MSKASRQSIALLAVINGCFKSMQEYNLAPALLPTIEYGLEISERCIKYFPETGDNQKNLNWMIEKIHCIDADINNCDRLYTMIVLSIISHVIITDLIEKIKDKKKLDQLEVVKEVVYGIMDQVDKNGDKYDNSFEEARFIFNKLYNYLEFSI